MKIMFIIFASLFTFSISAQDITNVEYFIDNDPGFGNGNAVMITPGQDITKNFIVDLTTVSDGFHVLYVRGKDSNGKWSIAYAKPFCKQTLPVIPPDIVQVEYFIDSDPGFGNGNAVMITPGQDITKNFILDLTTLSDGFHVLYVRGKDSNGKWNIAYAKPFYKQTLPVVPPDIVQVEYFIDNDPGFGNGNNIAITPGQDITVNYVVDLSALSDGFHVLYVRGKDSNGKWSIAYAKPFYKQTLPVVPPDIVQVEYFIDNDPGFGNGNAVMITHGQDITKNFILDLTTLSDGFHVLYVRGKDSNGKWSLYYSKSIHKKTAGVLPNIVAVKYYFSNSDTITPLYTYTNFSQSPDVNINFDADISALKKNTGYYLHIYGEDENGKRGIEYTHGFNVIRTNHPPIVSKHLLDTTLIKNFETINIADLDTIFTDPDIPSGDSLRYSVTVSRGIVSAYIESSMLKLTSVSDLVGIDTVIVTAVDDSGAVARDTMLVTILITGIQEDLANQIPSEFCLMQNYPNPFNPVTYIRFGLPKPAHVQITIYNTLGEQVAVVIDEMKQAGYYTLSLNTEGFASGIYFYRMRAGDFVAVKKFILLK